MSTLEFVSASADGIVATAAPLVTAPALVSGLGAHPAITVPLVFGRPADTAHIWRRLDETARWFGLAIAPEGALRDALHGFRTEAAARYGQATVAAQIQLVEIDGRNQFVVSGTVIDPARPEPVALATQPGPVEDRTPHWRRMADRTSSHAEARLVERELLSRGCADVVAVDGALIGCPRLGALIVETADGTTGLGADRLTLLQTAGLLDPAMPCSDGPLVLSDAKRAWWVSPRFETHPVRAIGTRRFEPEVPGHE
ncbi:hypothetical protein V4U86_14915 [Mycobacterium sp. AMU20-3851]|uniref:hypothetical protein n=1 Tax=Mycobacterium sp. AMU20-3851 TaxID=3122055 RepID=UPI003754E49C